MPMQIDFVFALKPIQTDPHPLEFDTPNRCFVQNSPSENCVNDYINTLNANYPVFVWSLSSNLFNGMIYRYELNAHVLLATAF